MCLQDYLIYGGESEGRAQGGFSRLERRATCTLGRDRERERHKSGPWTCSCCTLSQPGNPQCGGRASDKEMKAATQVRSLDTSGAEMYRECVMRHKTAEGPIR